MRRKKCVLCSQQPISENSRMQQECIEGFCKELSLRWCATMCMEALMAKREAERKLFGLI